MTLEALHAGINAYDGAAPPEDKGASAARAQILSLQAEAAQARGEGRADDELLAHLRAASAAAEVQRPRLAAVLLQRLGRALEAAGRLQDVVGAYESAVRALEADPARLGETIPWGLAPIMKGYQTSGEEGPVVLPTDPLVADLERAEADPLLAAGLLGDIGDAYLAQPQDGPAERAYRLALEELDRLCARERSGPPGEAELRARILNALALILQRRAETPAEREEAEAMARRALGLLDEGSPARRGPMTVLAALAADRGELDTAALGYREVLRLHHEAGDARAEARALVALGLVHRRRADAAAAREAFSRAAAIAEAHGDDEALWRARSGLAWCQETAGDLDGAIESLRQSIAVAGHRSRTLGTDEGRVSFLHGAGNVHDHLVDLCLRRAEAGAGPASEVLEAAEESRAQVLGSLPDPPLPPPRLSPDAFGVQAFSGAPGGMPMMAQMAISQPIRSRPARPRVEPPPAPLWRLVFHVLPDRTAILAVTPDGAARAHVAPIGRDALEDRIAALRIALDVAGPRRGLRFAHSRDVEPPPPDAPPDAPPAAGEALRALHDLLIAPVIDLVPPAAPLVLEPHGALWLVPFGALRAADGVYLADRNPLLVAPSARVLEQLRALAPLAEPAAQRALVIGNPTMPELAAADGRKVTLTPLSGAEDEARAICERFGERGTLLLGPDATEGAVVEAMRDAAVIHLATHGIADSADPLASMIALAPGPAGEDGVLTAGKLMLHTLVADLVALSACQTALGRISGEGMIGLGRALIWAGARSVLVSQWSVDDEATLELMEAFYRAYLGGADRATALQQAQRELRALSPRFEHPRYWAPFVLIGAER